MEKFETPHDPLNDIRNKLHDAGIDTSQWGMGGAKTIENLMKEISDGETELVENENGELIRRVVVGGAEVFYTSEDGKTYRLKEDRQVFTDGRERRRDFDVSVSEKMKPSEDPNEAMVRGMHEELGVEGPITLHEEGSYVETLDSPSYPGLRSEYTHHTFKAELSVEQFNPDGYKEVQDDKTTYFVWEEVA